VTRRDLDVLDAANGRRTWSTICSTGPHGDGYCTSGSSERPFSPLPRTSVRGSGVEGAAIETARWRSREEKPRKRSNTWARTTAAVESWQETTGRVTTC